MPLDIPAGFRFSGVACGIKRDVTKEDFSLVVCPRGAVAAGVYTQNLVYAAPVALDRERTPSPDIRVVAVNSGNANACTGERGLVDAREMARLAAAACGAAAEQALVMSTGIIGEFLPMQKIAAGATAAAAKLGDGEASFLRAAQGIMTTDRFRKVASHRVTLGDHEVRLAGMAKGAGMIGPRMATMLAVIVTDAALTPASAQGALSAAVEESFNCISVEGHMSTNDTVLLLASGAVTPVPLVDSDLAKFQAALTQLCIELARMIPDDGEGATHLVTIDVVGCALRSDARQIAKTIAESALVKTAICGGDPNWGRIVSAAGYAGVKFDPAKVDLIVNGTPLYRQGAPVKFDAAAVSAAIKAERETSIVLRIGDGPAACRFWTSDLTHEYIRINADYHT